MKDEDTYATQAMSTMNTHEMGPVRINNLTTTEPQAQHLPSTSPVDKTRQSPLPESAIEPIATTATLEHGPRNWRLWLIVLLIVLATTATAVLLTLIISHKRNGHTTSQESSVTDIAPPRGRGDGGGGVRGGGGGDRPMHGGDVFGN